MAVPSEEGERVVGTGQVREGEGREEAVACAAEDFERGVVVLVVGGGHWCGGGGDVDGGERGKRQVEGFD